MRRVVVVVVVVYSTHPFALVDADADCSLELYVIWFGKFECFKLGSQEISVDGLEVVEEVRIYGASAKKI